MSGLPAAQRDQLQGYGILPGRTLRVIQHTPVTVVQIEHSELAIEPVMAGAVLVELEQAPGRPRSQLDRAVQRDQLGQLDRPDRPV
jgi:Fe2+ transport system protein FeoA